MASTGTPSNGENEQAASGGDAMGDYYTGGRRGPGPHDATEPLPTGAFGAVDDADGADAAGGTEAPRERGKRP